MATPQFRDPVRSVDKEFLTGLTLESDKVFPLPGGVGRRLSTQFDPRLTQLKDLTPTGQDVVYYEHIATVRHTKSNTFFVAFRETMDAFLARHPNDPRYPEWLMKAPEKQAERKIHIYQVFKNPKDIAILNSHEQWLKQIENDRLFDAVAYFLAQNNVIDQKVLATLR